MQELKGYIQKIRRIMLESESYFNKKDPINSLNTIIENPIRIKVIEKEFKKFEDFDYLISVLNKLEPKTRIIEFKNMFQYTNEVLLNSLEISEEEAKFLAISICLKNIESLRKPIIQKFLARFVSKYRKNSRSLLYLENILIDSKETSENIAKLISISLIQYIRSKFLRTKVIENK